MPLLEQVLKKNPTTVKLVFKNFPLQRHAFSEKAAVSAIVAGEYGKFWPYHDRLFDQEVFGKVNDKKLMEIASELGIDPQAFEQKIKDPEIIAKVRRDAADGKMAGVMGTPTIFINGRLLRKRTLQGFQEIIDKVLAANGNPAKKSN